MYHIWVRRWKHVSVLNFWGLILKGANFILAKCEQLCSSWIVQSVQTDRTVCPLVNLTFKYCNGAPQNVYKRTLSLFNLTQFQTDVRSTDIQHKFNRRIARACSQNQATGLKKTPYPILLFFIGNNTAPQL